MSRVNYNTYPKSHNYITINYMSPKPTKRQNKGITPIPQNKPLQLPQGHVSRLTLLDLSLATVLGTCGK